MKQLLFNYNNARITDAELAQDFKQLSPEIIKAQQALEKNYDTQYAALALPTDTQQVATIKLLAQKLQALKPTLIIVVGIGGSNLGTIALYQALRGNFPWLNKTDIQLYCADTVDNNLLTSLLELVQQELEKKHAIIINIVTKSGTTTETIVNGSFFIELLKKYYPENYRDFLVITTDKNSPLWLLAEQENYYKLEIPKLVGGRYSVLSAVGLFPLALLGIDIDALLVGALDMRDQCLNNSLSSSAALSALVLYNYYKKHITIHDTFIFSPSLALFGGWYRQLVGESLGKSHDLSGMLVDAGITPTISLGTVDLHSVAQLYLGGPRDKITTFIAVDHEPETLIVPDTTFAHLVDSIAGKSVTSIKKSIFQGVVQAYSKEQRPFMTLIVPQINEYYLGQLIMFKMCEIIYVGHLLNVNAFDQPAVEIYKTETRRILRGE